MSWVAGNRSKCCGHYSDRAEKEVIVFGILKYSLDSLRRMESSKSWVLYRGCIRNMNLTEREHLHKEYNINYKQ